MAARVVIADEMDLVTQGLRLTLTKHGGWTVMAECHSLPSLEAALKAQPVDVLVCGQTLDPALDVLSLFDKLKRIAPRSRIVLIGTTPNGLVISNLFHAGLHGYLYKSDPLRECLPMALETLMRNRPYLSPTANAEYLAALHRERAIRLTPQQRSVLQMLAQGRQIAEIASALHLPARRVYTIRDTLRNRFGASTNEQLMLRMIAEGFGYPP